ncbi:nitrate- and nitrite sensing domain-containing protein [Catellatospora sp. KI3]|uniref:sensor histidine kinase n=1 Tax=Catellatospora sp. KI3 TaxID=3041620 RepID=UPI0024827F99|nr:nitrate- and nitrite sensing domain-containing protein [Catellatospora sp. KI3]MDI1463000.1 nitrate- and nitrite sensing domain-containing protein [Catellatospora sp. KI3]
MSTRTSNLRAKIVFLLVSLSALWMFAAFVTMREGLNLFWINTLDQDVGRPTDALVADLQAERRLSVVVLAGDTRAREDLLRARQATDTAVRDLRESVDGTLVGQAASPLAEQRIAELLGHLDRIAPVRMGVDTGRLDRAEAAAYYTDTVAVAYQIFATIARFDDPEINDQLSHLLTVSRGRELLSQEDAVMSGVLAAGRFTTADAARFAELVGAQRYVRSIGTQGLAADTAIYEPVLTGAALTRLRTVEDLVISSARDGAAPGVSQQTWRQAFDPALTELADLDIRLAEAAIDRSRGPIVWTIVRLILAAGLGLIAVIASIVLSITTARAIVAQLRQLRDAANELATVRLPRVVQRLRQGEEVDVAAEAPPIAAFGGDEIGQLGQAFNAAQETAIRTAVEQAELRSGVRDLFLSLARRSQTLVHRQLGMLDAMERRTDDSAELEELFRIDHLATRMRRNAENLIVLAGAVPGRGWRRTVPMIDVIRGAVAEVEEYPRLEVRPSETVGLAGYAVGDVIHLLAELMENALSFSPRHSKVHVGGSSVGSGYVIEIDDAGLGMTEADLAEANGQLAHPVEFSLSGTPRLGLYVVGKLAQRHHVQVRLQHGRGGGTTAVVLIPAALLAEGWTPQGPFADDEVSGELQLPPALPAVPRTPQPRPAAVPDAVEPGAEQAGSGPTRIPAPRDGAAAPEFTVSGLPVRQRRPSPHPAEAATTPPPPADEAVEVEAEPIDDDGPDTVADLPGLREEQVRALFSSFQSGSERGRREAGLMSVNGSPPAAPPPPPADRS